MTGPEARAPAPPVVIEDASGPADMAVVRALFVEYGESLNFDLCFQGFDRELDTLPGDYAPLRGALLLASVEGEAVGVVGLRALEEDVCEMKRLYVRPQWRNAGVGRRLAEAILRKARDGGYFVMRLDTLGAMAAARALYKALGFYEIPAYYNNPISGAVYMEKDLTQAP
ncbi:MAG: GNAT family N-acetyltransferase [Alphaproteobacteria bacterium]|nr:GNAT family N-acetyltransferase [Alphaproteobacteria bacterium]